MNIQEREQLIDALIEGDFPEADFLRLEAEMSIDPAVRQAYYDRLTLSMLLEAEAGAVAPADRKAVPPRMMSRRWLPVFAVMAAALVGLLGIVGLLLNDRSTSQLAAAPKEEQASGFGVIAGQSDAVWKHHPALANGALVPQGTLGLSSGLAQIELFSGVTVVIEGEAEFEIVSPMEMKVARGKVRARVPDAAHGFRIHTAEGEVVDLGTEFALDVSSGGSEVHVIDGEVEWHPRSEAMLRMAKGDAVRHKADGQSTKLAANEAEFVGVAELGEKLVSSRDSRHEEWLRFSNELRRDPRQVAYYRMGSADEWGRLIPNEAVAGAEVVRGGAVVAAARVPDRWGKPGGALDFSPAGSRVRVAVPGEYRSFTLMCWVKINSLDRWYNSLFLTDGAKVTQPHWQIMDDGRLFFSVKKYERSDLKKGQRDKYHFMSPPFWNASLSGQWLMIATTYDVDARTVTHFLNGQVLSEETIPEEYLVEKVTFGAASLGNWSEPAYRTDAQFAVRNLNGSMDEFALFSASLSAEEIQRIYAAGRP